MFDQSPSEPPGSGRGLGLSPLPTTGPRGPWAAWYRVRYLLEQRRPSGGCRQGPCRSSAHPTVPHMWLGQKPLLERTEQCPAVLPCGPLRDGSLPLFRARGSGDSRGSQALPQAPQRSQPRCPPPCLLHALLGVPRGSETMRLCGFLYLCAPNP